MPLTEYARELVERLQDGANPGRVAAVEPVCRPSGASGHAMIPRVLSRLLR